MYGMNIISMQSLLRTGAGILAISAAVAVVAPADAAITITAGAGGGNPAENVLFNAGKQTGLTVQGHTNNTGTLINFTGNGTEMLNASGGQAEISAVDGGFNYLEWVLDTPNTGYADFLLNLRKPNNTTNSVTLTFLDQAGNSYGSVFALGNGANWFRIQATDGDLISFGSLSTTADITNVRQVRVGGIDTIPAVPEPSTWAMMLGGFGLIGFSMRRRRKLGSTYA